MSKASKVKAAAEKAAAKAKEEGETTMTTQTVATNMNKGERVLDGVISIPLDDIVADHNFNARKDYGGETPTGRRDTRQSIEDLGESIKREGQLMPVVVRKVEGGKYSLINGFRRYAAAKAVGLPTLKAQTWNGTELDAAIANLAENTARNDLHTWELAQRCKELSDTYSIKGSMIAERIGKSKQHVNNLIRICSNVRPEILKRWQEGNGLCSMENLLELASMDKDAQGSWWVEKTGGQTSDAQTQQGQGQGQGTPQVKRGPGRNVLEAALEALKECKKDRTYKDGVRAALKFALGTEPRLTGVYDPDAVKEAAEKAKEAERAAKEAAKAKAQAQEN